MKGNPRSLRLGIFIVVALLILGAGVFIIGDKEFMFSSSYRLKAQFQDVSGLKSGADVRVAGLRQGTIDRIELPSPPDRKVTVVMKMHRPTRDILHKDSVASIKTEGILGDKFMDVSLGSQNGAAVTDGDVIRAEPTVDMAEVANGIAMQTQSALGVLKEDMEALKQNFLLRGYFNRRGYEDAGDLTRHAVARLPAGPPMKEFTFDTQKLFDKPDSPKLKDAKSLDEAGHFLEANGFGQAVVVAAGGPTGDSDKVRTQAQAQAMAVRDHLVQNFAFDDTRIKTLGLGKIPASGEGNRVRILVYGSRPAAAGASKASSSAPSRP